MTQPKPAPGKRRCQTLKAMRTALAEANGIAFSALYCTETRPCRGSCPACDAELTWLGSRVEALPKEQQVYPAFSVPAREREEVLAPCPAPAPPPKQAEAAPPPAGKTAQVMAINRHRMGTDGEGVCTLVGLWGCPMRCRYCFNPGCLTPQPSAALYTAPQLLEKLKQDSPYFLMSNGGVTFGGGEPLLSAGFILEFCRLADPRWKIRLETSLNCDYSLIAPLVPYVDKWYVDIKALDPALYFDYTAGMNNRVAPNLARLKEEAGAEKILLRIPYGRGFKTREQALEEQQQLCGQGYYTQVFEYMVPEGVKQEKRIGVYYENPSPRRTLSADEWEPLGYFDLFLRDENGAPIAWITGEPLTRRKSTAEDDYFGGERIGLLNYRQESLPKEPEEEEWMGDLMSFLAKKDDPPQTANRKKKKRRKKP